MRGERKLRCWAPMVKLCNRDVVALLLKTHPEAVMMKDEEGRTPMHHLRLFGLEIHNSDKEKERDHQGEWERVLTSSEEHALTLYRFKTTTEQHPFNCWKRWDGRAICNKVNESTR
uniref:Uncharacterized protein n=1 Tax=Grammatophora oceanica TaxID=210454 RepID=A0A7S1VNZ2_9STRA|mmetsp:Transcript_52063/g.77759  ORF Transcript_52063/g.77759 Transcript_52063/m.77759 type:complete len:116 (+) Transcript_52063:552-899(+)